MNTGLFRKEALARFMRVDAPGAVLTIAPPSTVAVLGVMAAAFVALVGIAVFGHAQMVAEGRGVVRLQRPPIVVRAPFSGVVHAVTRGPHDEGAAGDVFLEMDTASERAAHDRCAGVVANEQKEVAALEQRLASWEQATGAGHDAAFALVLLSQLRTQREKANAETLRCDALGAIVDKSLLTLPVDATVADVAVSAGARVHEGDALATLEPTGASLVGYAEIGEGHRTELAVGQAVRVKFDALPYDEVGAGSAHVARVLETLPSHVKLEGTATGSLFVEIAIDAMPARSGAARSGMTFTADILTRRVRLVELLTGAAEN